MAIIATPKEMIACGKTKEIWSIKENPHIGIVLSKSSITGGDGARKGVIEGKAEISNQTTCNVFRLLKTCGIPLAFIEQLSPASFLAYLLRMVKLEVVVRRALLGSAIQREPDVKPGTILPDVRVEFFLKTTDKQWGEHALPVEDPLMILTAEGVELYDPHKPIKNQKPFLTIRWENDDELRLYRDREVFIDAASIARKTFLVLEKAWHLVGGNLADFKVEFGFTHDGKLVLGDVLDAESCRILFGGQHIDKQPFRDGASISKVKDGFLKAMHLTSEFKLPTQRVIVWDSPARSGSEEVIEFLWPYLGVGLQIIKGMRHSNARAELTELQQTYPDSVVIACGDKEVLNDFGSLFPLPVIRLMKTNDEVVKERLVFPAATPEAAALGALRILSLHNPYLYMRLRRGN